MISGGKILIGKIAKETIHANAILEMMPIAEMKSPMIVDNFEGINIQKGIDGKNYIYLLSDDNFNPFQNTYLLMFEVKRQFKEFLFNQVVK